MDKIPYEEVPRFLGIVGGATAFCFVVMLIYTSRVELLQLARWLGNAVHSLFSRYVEYRPAEEENERGSDGGSEPEPAPGSGGAMRRTGPELAGSGGSSSGEIYAVLARLIADTNRRPLPSGKLSVTRALTSGLGLTKGSSRDYADAKARLEAALARLADADGARFYQLDEDKQPTGAVVSGDGKVIEAA